MTNATKEFIQLIIDWEKLGEQSKQFLQDRRAAPEIDSPHWEGVAYGKPTKGEIEAESDRITGRMKELVDGGDLNFDLEIEGRTINGFLQGMNEPQRGWFKKYTGLELSTGSDRSIKGIVENGPQRRGSGPSK